MSVLEQHEFNARDNNYDIATSRLSIDEIIISSASQTIHNDHVVNIDEQDERTELDHSNDDTIDNDGDEIGVPYNFIIPNASTCTEPITYLTPNVVQTSIPCYNDQYCNDICIPDVKNAFTDEEMDNHELSLYCPDNTVGEHEHGNIVEGSSLPPIHNPSLLDQLDIMFEKLCFVDAVSDDVVTINTHPTAPTRTMTDSYSPSMDTIIVLLGCYNPPSIYELEYFATLESQLFACCGSPTITATAGTIVTDPKTRQITKQICRRGRTVKRRVLEQLLTERGRTNIKEVKESSRKFRRVQSFSIVQSDIDPYYNKQPREFKASNVSSSFDVILEHFLLSDHSGIPKLQRSDTLSQKIYNEDNTDGYDSDPGLTYTKPLYQRSISPRSIIIDTPQSLQWNVNKYWYDTKLIRDIVEETMNSTWNLFWICDDKPIQVQVWIERGTVMQNRSIMVEPCLMWRPCYISSTNNTSTQSSSLSSSSKQPVSIRLLHICRLRPASNCSLPSSTTKSTNDYSIPKMYRKSTSFVIKTIDHKTIWFQASTMMERDMIIHQWKVLIARLATFAILEDTKPLLDEFFLDQKQFS
jgi:hypothetical protein